MIDEKLLELVRCPLDGQRLVVASQQLTAALNERIAQRQLRDRDDALIDAPLETALVSGDAARAYPVRDAIPTLIPNEAIPIPAELAELAQASVSITAARGPLTD